MAWGNAVAKRLRHLGLDVDGCDVDDERVVFVPDGRLSLVLEAGAVEVAVQPGLDDLPALRDRLNDAVGALELTTTLEALPEQFTLGLLTEALRLRAPGVTSDDLRSLLDHAEREGSALWLGWKVPREVAAAHARTLDEQLQDAAVALGAILKLLGRLPESSPDDARHGRRRHARPDDDARRSKRAHARGSRHDLETERERDEAEPEPDVPAEPTPPPSPVRRPLGARPILRAGMPKRDVAVPGAGIERGTRVRVLAGPFAGKDGAVQELDGNGGARVMLGLLAVRIDVQDLVSAEGHGRPRLSSSHRRPNPGSGGGPR